MSSSKKNLTGKISRDLILSILAIVIYNGVLQLVIYPGLNARMGAEAFGTVLYFISAVSIMGAGFGTSASYSRIVARKERIESNGDYNAFLGIVALICVPVSVGMVKLLGSGVADGKIFDGATSGIVGLILLMALTVIRYYCDVEYRMNIRFMDYFLFFVFVSLGYVVGLRIFDGWMTVILQGEVLGILYTIVRGSILRPPYFERSVAFADNLRAAFYISIGNLLSAVILNADRIFLRLLAGAEEVTVFYVASLIGKIVALLTTPLNGIIISYLAGYKIMLDRRKFLLSSTLLIVVTVMLTAVCTAVSYVFVKIMYPDVFAQAREYFIIANLGQLLYFLSGTLMVVVLSFSDEKLQMIINCIYAAVFAIVVIPMTVNMGISGMAYSLVIVNALRFMLTVIMGLYQLSHERASSEG
ncbi:lipopolysaccharide biosynthesis protein [Butyrivibrio sp. FCS014]|uniref:lipopolysaccharide biosynthesis protein n=1 Tax=Butyrivibrio sp. FCS014 TaxID=1408304 RepID=UPI000464EAED|nr:hypothetical protein [Butyrivibrio sp. FCS014]